MINVGPVLRGVASQATTTREDEDPLKVKFSGCELIFFEPKRPSSQYVNAITIEIGILSFNWENGISFAFVISHARERHAEQWARTNWFSYGLRGAEECNRGRAHWTYSKLGNPFPKRLWRCASRSTCERSKFRKWRGHSCARWCALQICINQIRHFHKNQKRAQPAQPAHDPTTRHGDISQQKLWMWFCDSNQW